MFNKVDPAINVPEMEEKILEFWKDRGIFRKTLEKTEDGPKFMFYEGPPTANAMPHPGHVLTRVIKDLIPRYRTMCGYHVPRKGGWDTHGLPVELEIEKELEISGKPQIEEYGVENFIEKCKESVFRYKTEWERMTERVGFWVDLEDAYVTYENYYIESVWWALSQIWEKGLLYKGHKVVPYCPRCGTALSSHEVAQGYQEVDDPSIYVKFPLKDEENTAFLVWTTTPWTLPSNVALAVHADATYVKIKQTDTGYKLILAKELLDSAIPEDTDYEILDEFQGESLVGIEYEPPFKFTVPEKKAWYVVSQDFVTLEDGTGIVHLAPAFGEDDMNASLEYDLPIVQPVDEEGRFTDEIEKWKGVFVKEADPLIIGDIKSRGRLFRDEQYTHTYPFCWRCDTPLLYYARTSWFIKTTAVKEALLRNNNNISWYPEHIKKGRMGNFLENVIDWAVSRERYWGTPLPIWICEDCSNIRCIGSIKELKEMAVELPERLELHRPYIDKAVLKCPECSGLMRRVPEVIDAWFDSGSMPFAQWHYPMENKEEFKRSFPADFISEAIDQTRGWFYTLLVISTLLFDEPSFKNVLVLGHVLDAEGLKMSKRRGNVVDTWEVFDTYGADAFRWYLYTVNPPWNPTRFYLEAVSESQRKFLSTLWNIYSFYVLYANVDGFDPSEYQIPPEERGILDKWIISRFNSLVKSVRTELDIYSITPAARGIERFTDDLSNWYVRRSRRRYWGAHMTQDKISAYLTLHEMLVGLSKLIAPFTPFISEEIYMNLEAERCSNVPESVHLCDYPVCNKDLIDPKLEHNMAVARKLVTLGRAARNKINIKIRQPLSEMVAILPDPDDKHAVKTLEPIIKEELNIKTIRIADETDEFVAYKVKPRFDVLGPKYGEMMRDITAGIDSLNPGEIVNDLKNEGSVEIPCKEGTILISAEELVVDTVEKEGFAIESDGNIACVLITELSPDLVMEGLAREMVNKIQTMRKDADLNVEDRIITLFWSGSEIEEACRLHKDYIMEETLSSELIYSGKPEAVNVKQGNNRKWNINGHMTVISVARKV